jgi:transposase, IS5 family
MERVVPWSALCALIEPFYPKPGNGRPPVGVERMLRIYFLQQWFNLSDPAVEEALYDSSAMRRFVDIDLGREPVPDETTVCRFVICSKRTIWASSCSTKCSGIWRRRD